MEDITVGIIILIFLAVLFATGVVIGILPYSKFECVKSEIINGEAKCMVLERKK